MTSSGTPRTRVPAGSDPGDRPLGAIVAFAGARRPGHRALMGRYVTLLAPDLRRDAEPLYRASHAPDGDPRIWTYLFEGPFADRAAFDAHLAGAAESDDPRFFTVIVDGRPEGMVSYLAIVPEHGSIELGNIWFAPALQRTRAASEAIYLLLRDAFDTLGYRRVEWKCNALNAPSRRAAERLGFRYEGTFLQHRVVKGHNRDTAWFAITDTRWPAIRRGLEFWLSPENFDAAGRQLHPLVVDVAADRDG